MRNPMRPVILLILGTTVIYLAILHSAVVQNAIVYMNFIRWPLGSLTSLERFNLTAARNFHVVTSDRVTLKGWHLPPPMDHQVDSYESLKSSKRILIYFHGNMGTRALSFRREFIQRISALLDSHVVTFDYRGFGDSSGWPSEKGTLLDSVAMLEWALQTHGGAVVTSMVHSSTTCGNEEEGRLTCNAVDQVDGERASFNGPEIYLYGHSLGTGVVLALMKTLHERRLSHVIRGVFLDAPFISIPDAFLSHPLSLPFRMFPKLETHLRASLSISYPNIENIRSARVPVLLIHGDRDAVIPVHHSRELYRASLKDCLSKKCKTESNVNCPSVRFTELEGSSHDYNYRHHLWPGSVLDFVNCTSSAQ